jgi:broad specificity phosphatase PhoE
VVASALLHLKTFRVLVAVLALLTPTWVSAAPGLVILVRHAEKQTTPGNDPSLDGDGIRRAEELSKVVAAFSKTCGEIRAIYASDAKRTQETVQPLSKATGVRVTVVKATDTDVLAKMILAQQGGIVVVAGHSNTVPLLIQALGGPPGLIINENQFDRLFVLTFTPSAHAELLVLRYGK